MRQANTFRQNHAVMTAIVVNLVFTLFTWFIHATVHPMEMFVVLSAITTTLIFSGAGVLTGCRRIVQYAGQCGQHTQPKAHRYG